MEKKRPCPRILRCEKKIGPGEVIRMASAIDAIRSKSAGIHKRTRERSMPRLTTLYRRRRSGLWEALAAARVLRDATEAFGRKNRCGAASTSFESHCSTMPGDALLRSPQKLSGKTAVRGGTLLRASRHWLWNPFPCPAGDKVPHLGRSESVAAKCVSLGFSLPIQRTLVSLSLTRNPRNPLDPTDPNRGQHSLYIGRSSQNFSVAILFFDASLRTKAVWP